MDASERRKYRRVPLPIQIHAETGGETYVVKAENISLGGMLIRAETTLEENERVTLSFTLPGTQREIRAEGIILHVSPGAFMGVRFESLSPADQAAIEAFIESADSAG